MPDAPHLPATYALLRVYDRDGVTLRDEIDAMGLSWTDELGGEGSAAYTVPFMQDHIVANPTLLQDAIVKVAVPLAYGAAPTEIFAWFSNPGSGVLIGDAQDPAHQESPASRGLMAVMDDWILMPENGFRRTAAQARFIGWMSKQDHWYKPADWHPPTFHYPPAEFDTGVVGVSSKRYRCGTNAAGEIPGNIKGACPPGFPDPNAEWIWDQNGNNLVTLFRTTFVTTQTQLVDVYISCDETFIVYLDSEEIIAGAPTENGYMDLHTTEYPMVLNPGTHTLAIAMSTFATLDIGDGADAMRCAVYTVGSNREPLTLLRRTDATNWQCFTTTLDGNRPGWTAAEIIYVLKAEAAARGIASMSTLALGFTQDLDSNGAPWSDLQERNWAIGTSGNTILSDLGETDITFDMLPSFTLNAYINQGTDLTPNVDCPVLAAGVNLIGYTWQGQPLLGTRIMIRSPEAYSMITNGAAEVTYSPREVYLESGSSASVNQANRIASKALTTMSKEHRSYTAEMVAKSGCTPYVDFGKGDTIWGLDVHGNQIPVRVLSIGGSRDDEGGIVRWILELAEPD